MGQYYVIFLLVLVHFTCGNINLAIRLAQYEMLTKLNPVFLSLLCDVTGNDINVLIERVFLAMWDSVE